MIQFDLSLPSPVKSEEAFAILIFIVTIFLTMNYQISLSFAIAGMGIMLFLNSKFKSGIKRYGKKKNI
jgi:hypothetical protein